MGQTHNHDLRIEDTERTILEDMFLAEAQDMALFAPRLSIMSDTELIRTPLTPSESQTLLFRVHDHIKYVLKQPVRIEALKSRQVYYSTGVAALSWRDLYINGDSRRHTVVAYNWPSTKNIMEFMWQFAAHMAPDVRVDWSANRSEPYELHIPHTHSWVDSLSGEKADPGRGGNRYFLHISELAMFRSPRDLMNALLPSVPGIWGTAIIRETTARGYDPYFQPHWAESEEMVRYYCQFFGAVDEMDLLFNRTGWGNKKDRNGEKHPNGWWKPGAYFPLFAGWPLMRKYRRDPKDEDNLTVERLTAGERQEMETYSLDLWQMAWRRARIRELGGSRIYHDDDEAIADFDQEHPITPERAFKSSGKPYIKRAVISFGLSYSKSRARETYETPDGVTHRVLQPASIRWARGHEPKYNSHQECTNRQDLRVAIALTDNSDLTIFKTPFRDPAYYSVVDGKKFKSRTWSNRYIIGADIAEGLAQGDYSAAYVLDRVSWEYVAQFHGHPSPLEFAEILVMMALYYDEAWIMGEYNDQGPSVVPRIGQLYNRICPRPDIQSGDGDTQEGKLWFYTTARSKKFLSDYLKEAIESKPRMMPFPRFYQEGERYVLDARGRIGADGKSSDPSIKNFDDTIIAAGQCVVGHMYAPAPTENITPQYATRHIRAQFEKQRAGVRSTMDSVPYGIDATKVL